MEQVKAQYEQYPYPDIPFFALPKKHQGKELAYTYGAQLIQQQSGIIPPPSIVGKKILVAGCGTLEPVVVALNNPGAAEIVAIDLSEASLKRLKKRWMLAKLRSYLGPKLPPLRLICTDLFTWTGESFDYILASNLLQHHSQPGQLLQRIAQWLNPNGLLRVVTYPKQSRIWMRKTAQYFSEQHLQPNDPQLFKKCLAAIQKLPADDARVSCFLSQPEIHNHAGLVDAFFHICEQSLTPYQWHLIAQQAGLTWGAEAQTQSSASFFLEELLPKTKVLPPWEKLQILDDALELCANPVLWWIKQTSIVQHPYSVAMFESPPTSIKNELMMGVNRIQLLLKPTGYDIQHLINALTDQVGPRVKPNTNEILPKLSLIEWWKELK